SAQLIKLAQCRISVDNVQVHLRILPKELLSNDREYPGDGDLRAPNAQLATVGVGQGLDLLYALAQLIENSHPAFEQSLAITRKFDTLRAAVKQPHAQTLLQIGDRLGDNGMSYGEALGGFRHATGFGHCQKDVEIPQFQLAPDAVRPMHIDP